MNRGTPHEVELVEDDEPGSGVPTEADDTAVTPGGGPAGGWTRRRRLALGAGLVGVVVAAGVVAQGVVDARERAWVAAVAEVPGVLAPLDGPPQVLWSAEDPLAITAATVGRFIGVVDDGSLRVRALDTRTGATAWETELVPAEDRADVPPGTPGYASSGSCWSYGDDPDAVICVADDGVRDSEGPMPDRAPTILRTVLLDPDDGTVLADLTEATRTPGPRSLALVGELVLLVSGEGTTARVQALRYDGTVAWETSVPVSAAPAGAQAWVLPVGDGAVLVTPDELHLLDASGTTVRSLELDPDTLVTDVTTDAVVVQTSAPDTLTPTTTTVVRADGVVTYDGQWLHTVDDGSAPFDALTSHGGDVDAWSRDGARTWSAEDLRPRQTIVLDGRVHLATDAGLVTLDARTGAELWRVSSLAGQGLMTDGRVLLATARPEVADGDGLLLVGLDRTDGSELWRSSEPVPVDDVSVATDVLVGYRWRDDLGAGVSLDVLG